MSNQSHWIRSNNCIYSEISVKLQRQEFIASNVSMAKNMIVSNFKNICFDKVSPFGWVLALFAMLLFWYFTMDMALMRGNLWDTIAYTVWWFHILLSILFGLFIATHIHKYRHTKMTSTQEKVTGGLGTFLGIVVTWCPACSITLAAYLGLAWLMASLPWYGLEVKIVGILILWRSQYIALRDIWICKVKRKK